MLSANPSNNMANKQEHPIELELRAEIPLSDVETLKERLATAGDLHSHTKRLSVMYFGDMGQKKVDIRVRITNRESEVVAKFGSFGDHDRVEIAQPISLNQFIGFVKMFSQFGFESKVGERETFNYALPDDILASLVFTDGVVYLEIEKMSWPEQLEKNKQQLEKIADKLGVTLLRSEDEFDMLCKRLNESVDWPFNGLANDYKRLKEDLKRYV